MKFTPFEWEVKTLHKLANTGNNPVLDKIMMFISNPYQWIIPMIALVSYLAYLNWQHTLISLFLGGISAGLADSINARIIKKKIHRIRPRYHLAEIRGIGTMNNGKKSFPSNHASNTMAIALMLSFFFPHTFIYGAIAVFAVGYSRIYCGAHFPLDVLAGWLHGAFWAVNLYMFYEIIMAL